MEDWCLYGNNQYDWNAGYEYYGMYAVSKVKDEDEGFTKVETKKMKRNKGKMMKVEDEEDEMIIEAIIDSGSIDTIIPAKMVDRDQIRETETSRRKGRYASATGGYIQNLGETTIEGEGEDGTNTHTFQQYTYLPLPVHSAAKGAHTMPCIECISTAHVQPRHPRLLSVASLRQL